MLFNEDSNKPVPDEVKFGDRGSAVAYAKKLGEFGYTAVVIRKYPYWVVKYRVKQSKSSYI
ncbi:MAG: hypothetical protein JSW38_01365 [Dehalococcoidia bacterium]|nr:MAG: hypothetical protein JSW38_01365 [Dehalococcoidia bacterium]